MCTQIFRPWVVEMRKLATVGEPDDANRTWDLAASWADGGIQELKAVMLPEEEAKDDACKIIRVKHNKSRTHREAMEDLSAEFKGKKRESRSDFAKHSSPALRASIERAYALAREGPSPLLVDGATVKEFATYFSALPYIMRVAPGSHSVLDSFVHAGLRDQRGGTRPSLVGMLQTLVRPCALV
jgi:hypothetical protein